MIAQKHKGALAELSAISWLLENGYEVFRNVSQHGPADVVAIKDGKTLPLDIKTRIGPVTIPLATSDQESMGVMFLLVGKNGTFEIVAPAVRPADITCDYCGKSSRGARNGNRPKRFCSHVCRQRAEYHRNKPANRVTRAAE